MRFTRSNYELFIIDYLEGNLNASDLSEFESFLNLNPDINESLISFSEFSLKPVEVKLQDKSFLLKTNSDLLNSIPEEAMKCIAYLEKDLSKEEESDFEKVTLEKPDLNRLVKDFELTFLTPPVVEYKAKEQLKKPVVLFTHRLLWIPSAAAAIVLVFFLLKSILLIPAPSKSEVPQISQGQQENQNTLPAKGQNSQDFVSKKSAVDVGKNQELKKSNIVDFQSDPAIVKSSFLANENIDPLPVRDINSNSIALLEIKTETLPSEKYDGSKLHPPVIIIPQELTPQVLSAFEAYTIVDFRVKLFKPARTEQAKTPLLVSLADAGIKSANKITGSKMELNTASDNQGKLTAFAFNSRGLKIASDIKKK